MTKTNLLVSAGLLLVAACGDQGVAPADAFHPIFLPDAAAVDALASAIDATSGDLDATSGGIDATGSGTPDAAATTADGGTVHPATNVWVFGDFITNNFQQLGNFTDPVATAPIVPATVPAVAAKLDSVEFSAPYSVTPDGNVVAYSTITLTGDEVDVITHNGTPVTVFTSSLGEHVTDLALSPDGKQVALRADLNVTGMFDIYIFSTDGNSHEQVSPDRAINDVSLDASGFLTWSADSRYLAYSGEFTNAHEFELHVFDFTNSIDQVLLADGDILTEGVGNQSIGVLSPVQYGAGDSVFVLARVDVDGDSQLLTGSADGMVPLAVVPFADITRAGDSLTAQVSTFALSSDLKSVAFAADGVVANASEVYVDKLVDTSATIVTSGLHTAGQVVSSFQAPNWNHGSSAVAVHASYGATAGKFQPYVIDVKHSTTTRLATIGDDTDASLDSQGNIAWTNADDRVYVIADSGANNFSVYALDVTKTDQAMTALVTNPINGDILDVFTR